MKRRIALLGTGAIGSSIGADLTGAGYDVVLIDQWPAHVEAMKRDGLHVSMPDQELHTPVSAMHLCDMRTVKEQYDIVFLTAKSYDTRWMVHFIEPYLKRGGVLASIQNSLNDEWIAPIIGYERDIGSVIELSATMFEPGRVKRNTSRTKTWFALGELHGRVTPRVQELAEILRASGTVEVSTNIWGAKWTKLVVNSMFMSLCGILGILDWEIAQNPRLLRLGIELGKEAMQVGTTLGYRLEPIFGMGTEDFLGSSDEVLKNSLTTLLSHIGKESLNCIYQDHLKGRRTETEFLNGLVVKKGQEVNIQTPLNEVIASMTKQVEQGLLKPNLSNLPILESLVGPIMKRS
jgi:2-dehydropantoate 2-reductase